MGALVEAIAQRSFGGTLPNLPEAIALALIEVCFPDASAEELTAFMTALLPAIEARLESQHRATADQDERTRRLSELGQEISAARGKIHRSLQDEKLVQRIWPESPQRAAELFELQAERERAESALSNLAKEQRELSSGK
jgi:hypothetical protein